MKTEEDEAFDELARKQGMWGGGFPAKRKMAADKQHWNEDEWRRNNWRCGHGWLRGEQCESCNAPQPPSEWAGIKAILDEYGLQAIDFVADFKAVLAQPAQEPVAHVYLFDHEGRPRIAWDKTKGIKIGDKLYTAPPQREWVGLTEEDMNACEFLNTHYEKCRAIETKLKEKNT